MPFVQETIEAMLERINKENSPNGLFLPHIQRDFVWSEKDVYRLLDSLMRGYPIGTILTWQTDDEIAYRKFIETYFPTGNHDFDATRQTTPQGTRRTYVLDGQQRLQSLYLACRGNYGRGRELYFNLLSDKDNDDGYRFQFLRPVNGIGPLRLAQGQGSTWINVKDFLGMSFDNNEVDILQMLAQNNIILNSNNDEIRMRIGENAIHLYEVFKINKVITRQALSNRDVTLDDVVEVFVRANAGGVVLEKADLLMALLRGRWTDADEQFGRIHAAITKLGYTKIKDFVLRACLAMIGRGAYFRANTFTSATVQNEIRMRFNELAEAIHDVLKFVADFRFLKIQNAAAKDPLLLAVCYRYHHPEVWGAAANNDTMRKFLFTAFLSEAFDNTPRNMMNDLLEYVATHNALTTGEIELICRRHGRTLNVPVDQLLGLTMRDPKADIVLQLFYTGRNAANTGHYDPTLNTHHDHIFPLAMFRQNAVLGYTAEEQNSILNCEMLTPTENQQRGATPPDEFFPLQDPNFLAAHAIPPGNNNLLQIDHFRDFLNWRRTYFVAALRNAFAWLGITDIPPN